MRAPTAHSPSAGTWRPTYSSSSGSGGGSSSSASAYSPSYSPRHSPYSASTYHASPSYGSPSYRRSGHWYRDRSSTDGYGSPCYGDVMAPQQHSISTLHPTFNPGPARVRSSSTHAEDEVRLTTFENNMLFCLYIVIIAMAIAIIVFVRTSFCSVVIMGLAVAPLFFLRF